MYSLWFLPAILLVVLLFTLWLIRRSQIRELCNRTPLVIHLPISREVVPEPAGAQARQVKWVSNDEFMTVLTKSRNLLVIDIRTDAPSVPFPVPTAFMLHVSPKELVTVLKSIPADKSIALCGASNLSIFMIRISQCMKGSAPLYVLKGNLRLAEAA
jgi:hypothetical protein